MDKFLNKAIIGNKNIVASFSQHGELNRFCFPYIDGRQFIDFFHTGVKINDSNIIYLHKDINNTYSQSYVDNTNVLVTNIKNTYFNLQIEQTDFVTIDENILVKKFVFNNMNSIDLDLKFIAHSKILSNSLENYGSKIFENGIIQYNHNYTMSIFSKNKLYGHRLNDVQNQIGSGTLEDKDIIGMSNEVAVSYDVGTLKRGEKKTFYLYISVDNSANWGAEKISRYMKLDDEKALLETIKFWKSYLNKHTAIKLEKYEGGYYKKIKEIYDRTILLYPMLINYDYGGVAAALEVDDERQKSGGYRYCWTRDAIFIAEAFDLLKMEDDTERFYNKFCRKTQSENGMWEQRFFTDGSLAPCWGYQIDETASVVYGVYNHYLHTKDKSFLEQNLKMCENAVKFLDKYVESLLNIDEKDLVKKELDEKYKKAFDPAKHISYDLWEMNEGVHLYSLSAIIAGYQSMKNIYSALHNDGEKNARLKFEKRNKQIMKLDKYIDLLQVFINENLIDNKQKILKRNLSDKCVDISVMGAVYPFNIFAVDDKVIKNTVSKINMTLKTYKDGYLRFEGDDYMNGDRPWVITTLWMALYYLKAGNKAQAEKCFKFVVENASDYGFLPEQVCNKKSDYDWVVGLGWSHAMFVIALDKLLKS